MSKYYIPANDAVFDGWFNNLVEYVLAKVLSSTPAWPHIPAAEAEKLAASCTAWYTAFTAFQGPHTKVDTEAKTNKRAMRGSLRDALF